MEFHFTNVTDDDFPDEIEQIKSISKKSWLSTASSSLANLERVQANVYNVGLTDPKDLKATNLRSRRHGTPTGSNQDPATDRSSVTSAKLKAWGSNSSIPDSLKQLSSSLPPKPTRPASAKVGRNLTRPPSGRKPRPQSAKEPLPSGNVSEPVFGVKGAKYDPSGRPPKGVPNTSSMGWVGPPAGLKYPDRPPDGVPWQMDFPVKDQEEEEHIFNVGVANSASTEAPPPPNVTPEPRSPEPEERTKRVFELFIGDPYKLSDSEDVYDNALESSDDEDLFAPPSPEVYHTTSQNQDSTCNLANEEQDHSPEKESLKLCLPVADDDFDEIDDVDTERLLAEAESVSKQFDLKGIIAANRNIPAPEEDIDSSSNLSSTNQNQESQSHDPEPTKHRENIGKLETEAFQLSDVSLTPESEQKVNSVDEDVLRVNIKDTNNSAIDKDKTGVKFDENVTTVNITPRNIGRKVEELHQHKKKPTHHNADSFVDLIEIRNRIEPVLSAGKAELTERESRSPPRSFSKPPVSKALTSERSRITGHQVQSHSRKTGVLNTNTVMGLDTRLSAPCNRPHASPTKQRPSSAPLNRAFRPVTTVTVDYGEAEEVKEKPKKEPKKKTIRKGKEDVVTMVQKINLDDEAVENFEGQLELEEKVQGHSESKNDIKSSKKNEKLIDLISAPTVYKSEHEKNYYEISRHSSLSNLDTENVHEKNALSESLQRESSVYKTTKTLEFDENEPKETTVKCAIDPHVVSTREKERVLASSPDLKQRKLPRRPSSAKPTASKKQTTADEPDLERPGSRLGFVAMAPDIESKHHKPKMTRPSSAPTYRRPKSDVKGTENKAKDITEKKENKKKELTEKEKDDREKVIDNLLHRTRALVDETEEKTEEEKSEKPAVAEEKKKPRRPYSAHTGTLSRCRDETTKTALKRPTSALIAHRHHASHGGTGRKKTPRKPRVILTEPCIINTNTSYFEEETEEDIACQEMEKELAKKGVNISAATLQRALYPPSGKSKYYQITADLPRKTSLSLLSHPKVWLPEEYKRLQRAEKNLARANEIMFLQEKAEKRRAYLESLTPEERKKLKKKGKKGGRKLRRSKTTL